MMSATVLFWGLAVLAVACAATVVLTTDVMRMGLGLGGLFLALAGQFAVHGFGFLALAEVFLYVGGVLVLIVFAIMLVHRTEPGVPSLGSRHDSLAGIAAVGVSALLVTMLRPFATPGFPAAKTGIDDVGSELLGRMLPHFEMAGLLLLAALVAVVSLTGGERR